MILFCLTTDVSLSHIELEIVEKLWCPRSLLKALDTFLLWGTLGLERRKKKRLLELNWLVDNAIHREIQNQCCSDTNGILRSFAASAREQRCTPELTSRSAYTRNGRPSRSRRLCPMTGGHERPRPGSNLFCSYVNRRELHPLQWKPSGLTPEQLKLEACPKWAGAHYKTK